MYSEKVVIIIMYIASQLMNKALIQLTSKPLIFSLNPHCNVTFMYWILYTMVYFFKETVSCWQLQIIIIIIIYYYC